MSIKYPETNQSQASLHQHPDQVASQSLLLFFPVCGGLEFAHSDFHFLHCLSQNQSCL